MAFKAAKNYGNKRVDVVRVTKKDSGFLYIPNKLSRANEDEDRKTEIRMLPFVDGTGEVYDPLRPDGSPKEMDESLGVAFCKAELVQFFKGGLYTFLTTVKSEDKERNPVQGATPWSRFMRRIDFKLAEMRSQLKQGGEVEPGIAHWLQLKEGAFSRPQELYFIQCLAKKVDGEVKTKDGKVVPIGPAIFAIPRYIQTKTEFFNQMLSVDDDEADNVELSPQTCKLGDFYTPEHGKALRLSRTDQEGNTFYSMELGKKEWPLKVDDLKQMVRPWDDILDVLSIEDSIKEIAKLMEPRMLAYAFRNSTMAPYLQEVGIDVDIARDIIEAEVAIVKGERKRSGKELQEHMRNVGSATGSPFDKDDSKDTPSEDNEDIGDIQYTPTIETDDEGTKSRYQDAMGQMEDLNLE